MKWGRAEARPYKGKCLNRLEDQDGDVPVSTLLVHLEPAVAADEDRPAEALALFWGRLSRLEPPCFPSQLNLCLKVSAKVEVPRGVMLLAGVRGDYNQGLLFRKAEDGSGARLAALPSRCGEENHGASQRADENATARQPIDDAMDGIEEACSGQLAQQHVKEAARSRHTPTFCPAVTPVSASLPGPERAARLS
jgi:hypothetical protein